MHLLQMLEFGTPALFINGNLDAEYPLTEVFRWIKTLKLEPMNAWR